MLHIRIQKQRRELASVRCYQATVTNPSAAPAPTIIALPALRFILSGDANGTLTRTNRKCLTKRDGRAPMLWTWIIERTGGPAPALSRTRRNGAGRSRFDSCGEFPEQRSAVAPIRAAVL